MDFRKFLIFFVLGSLLLGDSFSPGLTQASRKLKHIQSDSYSRASVAEPQAPMATYTVCTSGCDFSSIQDAIDFADDGDIIALATEIYTETITIDKSIDLVGDGAENTIIQAAGGSGIATSRVITITSGITSTIEALTIRYGNAVGTSPQNEGGGIYNLGVLTLREVEVNNNTADGYGGGIRTPSSALVGTLTVISSTIRDNQAGDSGGGIYGLYGSITLSNTYVINNSAAVHGGGISGNVYAHHLIVQENQAGDHGGGIYTSSADIHNSAVISNTAGNSGGGIFNRGFIRIYDSQIVGNQGGSGSGIYNDDTTWLVNTSVSMNDGIGIYNNTLGQLTITASTIGFNSGAGLVNQGDSNFPGNVHIYQSTITGNNGSGIRNYCNLALYDSTVSNNVTSSSGGGIWSAGGSLTLSNSTISGNAADDGGGGIFKLGGNLYISHSTITANTADNNGDGDGQGGGFYNDSDRGDTVFRNAILAGNTDLSATAPDCGGENIESGDYNLIGDTTGCSITGTLTHNIFNQPAALEPLTNNGGDTYTHALELNSPALDAGVCTDMDGQVVVADQRGILRPSGLACDIGSHENAGLHLLKTADDPYPNPGQVVMFTLRASNTLTDTVANAFIFDTIPVGLEFAGPITLETSGAGIVGVAPPTLAYSLTLDPGSWITVTFPVTVSSANPIGTFITNTATISGTGAPTTGGGSQVLLVCANTVTVTSTADNGIGSLREALTTICPKGIIDFDLTFPATITLTTGEIYIQDAVQINGPGAELLEISANRLGRVLHVTGDNVYIRGITIRDGDVVYPENGGGIFNEGSLTIEDSLVTKNFAHDDGSGKGGGGGIYTTGLLTITNSVLISNTVNISGGTGGGGGLLDAGYRTMILESVFKGNATLPRGYGGAINRNSRGVTDIDGCWIDNNTAGYSGGGIYVEGWFSTMYIQNSSITRNTTIQSTGGAIRNLGNISISNSTISANHANGSGGAIYQWGDIREMIKLFHVTFRDNSTGGTGNDLFRYAGIFNAQSSVFASNVGGDSCAGHAVGSSGYNLGIDDSCGLNEPTDLPNTDPLLGPLVDNGGETLTHALLPESPAIDHGACWGENGSLLTTDQRGAPRPQGIGCDIGAYEAASNIIFVDADATGAATGFNWADAYTNVQDALTIAISGTQIWVAEGIYYPDEGFGQVNDVVTSTFTLTDGVRIYGGFDPGSGADEFTERDWETYIIVLSGDLEQNDLTDPNGVVTDTENISGTNAWTVVTSLNVTDTAVLDGFTITAGNAYDILGPCSNDLCEYGGGLYNLTGDPSLLNITFSGNRAYLGGGGMYNSHGNPVLNNITFSRNVAINGGGMFNHFSNPVINEATFSENRTDFIGDGGGMYNDNSNPVLNDVIFEANIAGDHGGGVYNLNSAASFVNLTFTGNTAESGGGGMSNEASDPILNQVIFFYNEAGFGAGVFNYQSSPIISDTLFIQNSAALGGGMDNYESIPSMFNVTFSGNIAVAGAAMHNFDSDTSFNKGELFENVSSRIGGGIYNENSNPFLSNIVILKNEAANGGGGIYNLHSNPRLVNVTIGDNQSAWGGGVYNFGGSQPVITNTIIWANRAITEGAQIYNEPDSFPLISYSTIQDSGGSGSGWDISLGIDGGGNLDADPYFVDTPNGDLHLLPNSPAIDSGDISICPLTDLDDVPRPQGMGCDMGAYETLWVSLDTWVDTPNPLPGQTITFTIRVSNYMTRTLTSGVISDTLPAGLNFVGPITLEPPFSGTVGSAPPMLVTDLEIAPGQQITVTFPISVSFGLPAGTLITNTATLTASQLLTLVVGDAAITIANLPPLVEAGPDQTVGEGELVQFQGVASDPNLRVMFAAVGLHWDFGDGISVIGVLTPTHTYLDDSVYTATLTVTDTFGSTASDWLLVTVENVAPILSPFPDQEASAGEVITVAGTITDPGIWDTQTVLITWTVGYTETLELSAAEHQFTVSHAYAQPGEYAVTIRVIDKDGGWDEKGFMVAIFEQIPLIHLPLVMK